MDVISIPGSVKYSEEPNDDSVSYKLAVVSNSVLVQIIDEKMKSEPLVGHSEVVLAIDASPDGYS